MLEIFIKLIPLFVYCLIGYYCKKSGLFTDEGMNQIKKFITKILLSCMLFMLFIDMELTISHIGITVFIFCLNVILYFIGKLANKIPLLNNRIFPFYATSYCFGFLGIPLFTLLFGIENIDNFAIFGVGHELFVWSVFYFLIHMNYGSSETLSFKTLILCFKSPVLLSTIFALTLNLLGIGDFLINNTFFSSILSSFDTLGNIVTPLILINIGYSLSFEKNCIKEASKMIIARCIIVFAVGYALKPILDMFIVSTPISNAAYFIWLSLPPIYSYSVLASDYLSNNEQKTANTACMLHTIICVFVVTIYAIIN